MHSSRTMQASKNKLSELQTVLSRMSIEVFYMAALPELGVRWQDVTRAVSNARLPMTPASIAKIICTHAAEMPESELDDIVSILRLKLVATQTRTWYVINLMEPISDVPVNVLARTLPTRVLTELRKAKNCSNMRPKVQTVRLGDLIYMSVQLTSSRKQSSVLYVATPPGEPVALVSSVHSGRLLKPIVQGLGYHKYEDASLHGPDVVSLLRIYNRACTEQADHLANVPEYSPMPVVTSSGVDYTNKDYNEQYVQTLVGPDPPILTSLIMKSTKAFFDTDRLDKKMNLTVNLRSEDIAKTLMSWAVKGAVAPTSDLFKIFHKIKSNKISCVDDD